MGLKKIWTWLYWATWLWVIAFFSLSKGRSHLHLSIPTPNLTFPSISPDCLVGLILHLPNAQCIFTHIVTLKTCEIPERQMLQWHFMHMETHAKTKLKLSKVTWLVPNETSVESRHVDSWDCQLPVTFCKTSLFLLSLLPCRNTQVGPQKSQTVFQTLIRKVELWRPEFKSGFCHYLQCEISVQVGFPGFRSHRHITEQLIYIINIPIQSFQWSCEIGIIIPLL